MPKTISKPVTVGFLLPDDGGNWIGGANYLSNLLTAVAAIPERTIATVLFAAPTADAAALARFPANRIVRTSLMLPRHPLRLAGKLSERALGQNLLLERLLRRHDIDIVSHAMPAGRRPRTPTLSWIADFQERHIPDFFSPEERTQRAAGHRHVVDAADTIILSSEHARYDLLALAPEAAGRSAVLRFVAGMAGPAAADLRARYRIEGPFFHLPNQFWIHKNHKVVIDALALLRARGRDLTVVCTGHTGDYRHPDFFASIEAYVADRGVGDLFRIEGLVPYPDVAAFLRESVAVINPSLFEGWSTTVEEAKSSGKRILLSDIPVHREQAPEHGRYFDPADPAALARLMEEIADSADEDDGERCRRAAASLPGRFLAFGQAYQAIVMDARARFANDAGR